MTQPRIGADAVRALPELVGRRVTLRYRTGAGASGEIRTDAVGELAMARPDSVVVHTRGGPVHVDTRAVVAVREIPPARPKRPSWAAVTRLEGICADGWPAVVDRPLGQWRLRAAGGFTGRANSCLAVGDPGRPIPDALAEIRAFAAEHDLPARVQVPDGSPWHSAVSGAGWTTDDGHPAGWRVAVLVADLAGTTESAPAPPPATVAEITVEGRARWRVAAVEPVDAAQEHVLRAPELAHLGFAVARSGAELAGAVRLAVLDEHLYVTRLTVAADHRRQGLATALMAAATGWAIDRGARWCVLQVASQNAPALALYERLGFAVHHHYLYLRPAAGAITDTSQQSSVPDHPAEGQRTGKQPGRYQQHR